MAQHSSRGNDSSQGREVTRSSGKVNRGLISAPGQSRKTRVDKKNDRIMPDAEVPFGKVLFFERQDKMEQIPVGLRLTANHSTMDLDNVFYKMKAVSPAPFSTVACAEPLLEDPIALFAGQRLARRKEIESHARFIFSESVINDLPV